MALALPLAYIHIPKEPERVGLKMFSGKKCT